MTTQGRIVLVRSKADSGEMQLYVVATESGPIAAMIAQVALGPDVVVEPNARPLPKELARAMNLKPGQVRKF
jgi:hypothetical protein